MEVLSQPQPCLPEGGEGGGWGLFACLGLQAKSLLGTFKMPEREGNASECA